jgi:tRNA 2-selenouridine synthase SelU
LGYTERLLSNKNVEKYLAKHHSDLLSELKKQLKEKTVEMVRTRQISNVEDRGIAGEVVDHKKLQNPASAELGASGSATHSAAS